MQVYAAAAEYAMGNYKQSIRDMRPLSKQNQDPNTLGLRDIVTVLDNARLNHERTISVYSKLKDKSAAMTQEFEMLAGLK